MTTATRLFHVSLLQGESALRKEERKLIVRIRVLRDRLVDPKWYDDTDAVRDELDALEEYLMDIRDQLGE